MKNCGQCGAKLESRHLGEPVYCGNCGAVPGTSAGPKASPKGARDAGWGQSIFPRPSASEWMRDAGASGQGELNFARALSEVMLIAQRLSLPGVVLHKAGAICKGAFADLSITRAFSLKVLSASSLYVASCQLALGVTVSEAAESANVPRSEVIKCSRKLQRKLRIVLPTPTPHEYASRMLVSLGITQGDPLAVEVGRMMDRADMGAIQGKNPAGIACACIYLVSRKLGIEITLRMLGRIGYVTEATIRNACSTLAIGA